MLKKILLLVFVSVAGLGLLRQLGVVTGVAIVDKNVEKLDSSLRNYAQTLEGGSAGDEGGGRQRLLNDALTFADQLLQPSKSKLETPLDEESPKPIESVPPPVEEVVAPVELTSAPTNSSPPRRNEGFILQVGAFRNPTNAERLAVTLREQDSEVWTYLLDSGLYAVRMGPFRARILAYRTARVVADATSLSPVVIRVN